MEELTDYQKAQRYFKQLQKAYHKDQKLLFTMLISLRNDFLKIIKRGKGVDDLIELMHNGINKFKLGGK